MPAEPPVITAVLPLRSAMITPFAVLHVWGPVIAELSGSGFQTVQLDLAGFGDRTQADGPFTFDRFAAAFAVYGASKAAIRNFVRGWTAELSERRIRTNVLSPGPITTSLVAGQPQDAIEKIASTIPMGRMGEPDEVAEAALFLASDDSSFITGIELFVDGGRAQI